MNRLEFLIIIHSLNNENSCKLTLKFEIGATAAGTEDITKLLEDVGLNLQSIMSSRFVRPFSEEVHKWETRLGSVSECLEVWLNVQRKWMYLGES